VPRQAEIVIGANFGDEGKGLVTDFLSAQHSSDVLVIRHSGGAQAGHTVVAPDGRRCVFGHSGSGSLAGAKTLLSRFYVCNPIIFFKEKELLDKQGVKPVVYVDPEAAITTPYDMMINQIAEETRGKERHGSVGHGFGETVERNLRPEFSLKFHDIFSSSQLKARLEGIQKIWVPQRLAMLGLNPISDAWQDRLYSEQILLHYLEVVSEFLREVRPANPGLISDATHIIFEGAQGLLLDQEKGFFPHVTRSHTGIRNALQLASEYGVDDIEVTYVTRAYTTRHGAGPLPHELEQKPYPKIQDLTNIPHDYQGVLRFAWLDLDLLNASIQADIASVPSTLHLSYGIAVTCLDQIENPHSYVVEGKTKKASIENFLIDVCDVCRPSFLITSKSPSRHGIARQAILRGKKHRSLAHFTCAPVGR
jgi:adenylosuccinate synthase